MPIFSARRGRALFPLALVSLTLVSGAAAAQPIPSFAHNAFSSLWDRTDAPVASGAVKRTWFWGPQPNSPGLIEEYKEGAGGKRLVQYFDKSRMEINDPNADPNSPFYVTNGLLTVELISGRMQTGRNSFETRQPSRTNVTGDASDPLSPSYADLAGVSSAGQSRRDPDRTGQQATATLDKQGKVEQDPSKAAVPGATLAYYEPSTGHNVARAMWDFLNSSGPVKVGGALAERRLIEPWFYASGLPISDPYWVRATISGKPTDVLLQAFERRVLTYVPMNPEGFKVEMGNIGQHYYSWRYSNGATPVPGASPTPAAARPISRYAVDLNGDTSASTLDLLKGAGVGAVRLYISWRGVEPSNLPADQFRWASYDARFKDLSDRGLQPIVVVDSCPTWACDYVSGPIRPEHMGDFANFMSALADRYGKAPFNVHYWELWNEPDDSKGADGSLNWGLHGDQYAAMLRAVRPGVKAADPQAQLVLGGVAYDNFQKDGGPFVSHFVDDLLNAGGGQYLDVFNFHYYIQNVNWCSPAAKLKELKAKLTAHGLNLPIMSTETGFTSGTDFQSNDERQSLYAAQVYAQYLGEGLISTTWFTARDFNTDIAGWKIFEKSGLFDLSGAPKPSYAAYKTAASRIGERPAVRRLGSTEGVAGAMRGYEFGPDAGHGGSLWVLWAWDFSVNGACGTAPQPTDFSISPTQASNLRGVFDMYGQPVSTRTRAGGGLTFSLDARPLYVEWAR